MDSSKASSVKSRAVVIFYRTNWDRFQRISGALLFVQVLSAFAS